MWSSDFVDALVKVTPYAGVWIEIIWGNEDIRNRFVTPYAGVWIEISIKTVAV